MQADTLQKLVKYPASALQSRLLCPASLSIYGNFSSTQQVTPAVEKVGASPPLQHRGYSATSQLGVFRMSLHRSEPQFACVKTAVL